MDLHIQTLAEPTKNLLYKIKGIPDLQSFYLSGGTALALHLGHRESEDLDFFTKDKFDTEILQQRLSSINKLEDVEAAEGTLNLFLENVKLQFLHYPYNLLEEPQLWNGILLSSVVDIACTKLITISMRGSKKDFIDLFFIMKQFSLNELFKKLDEKYSEVNYSHTHILKSLVYFDDADAQPMPRMHISINWEDVKTEIIAKVKELKF